MPLPKQAQTLIEGGITDAVAPFAPGAGLDPERHVLLEIATIVTDNNLRIIEEGPVLAIRQPKSELAKMDAWCTRTHTGSGLLERVRKDSVSLGEAERQTLKS